METYGGGTARLVVHEDAHVQARISLKKIAMGTVTVRVSEKVKEALVCVSANGSQSPSKARGSGKSGVACGRSMLPNVAFPSLFPMFPNVPNRGTSKRKSWTAVVALTNNFPIRRERSICTITFA